MIRSFKCSMEIICNFHHWSKGLLIANIKLILDHIKVSFMKDAKKYMEELGSKK